MEEKKAPEGVNDCLKSVILACLKTCSSLKIGGGKTNVHMTDIQTSLIGCEGRSKAAASIF